MAGPFVPPFNSLSESDLDRCLADLAGDLARLPGREPFAWVLAATFNELLAAVKLHRPDDPVAATTAAISAKAIPSAATTRALIEQLRLTLEDES